jgi:hypothetical protein
LGQEFDASQINKEQDRNSQNYQDDDFEFVEHDGEEDYDVVTWILFQNQDSALL